MDCICRLPHCVCSCQCIKPPPGSESEHTELPPGPRSQDVPPDLVASVIRSSSGFFSGTLSAVSTISGHISPAFSRVTRVGRQGDTEGAPPPPYEAPPSYKAALQEHQAAAAMSRADTV